MSAATQAVSRVRRMRMNPVLRRELVERWRGRRAFLVVTLYLTVLVGLMLLMLWVGRTIIANEFGFGFGNFANPGPLLGRFLLENLVGFVLLLVLFIGPGYAAAQISGERERKTLGLLQITLVSPWAIVTGKLGAAVAWLLLLVLAAAPLGAAAFFLGGVTFPDLARSIAYLVGIAVAIAAMGIGVSSAVRSTTAAIVATYALVLLLTVGSLFATLVEVVVREPDFGGGARPVSLLFNPFYGLADAAQAEESFQLPSVLTPFGAGLPDEDVGVMRDEPFPVGGLDGPAVQVLDAPAPVFDEQVARQPVWLQVLGLHLALGGAGLLVASRRVRPGHGPRRRRRDRSAERLVETGVPLPPGVGVPPPPLSDVPPPPPPMPPMPPPHGGAG